MIIILIFSIIFIFAKGEIDFKNLEEQAKELVPAEAKKFFNSLTAEDKNVLREIVNKSSHYSTVDDVLNELKNRSSILFKKAVGVVNFFKETLDSLSPAARKFVEDTIQQLHGFVRDGNVSMVKIKTEANSVVQRYLALDGDTKEELRNAFPIVSTIVHNAIFQTMANSLFGIGGDGGRSDDRSSVPLSPPRDFPPNDPVDDNPPKDNVEENIVRKTIKHSSRGQ